MKFYYVYILESVSNPGAFYYGFTENLEQRLKEHNAGKSPHTAKHKPWRIVAAIAVEDKHTALKFEKYIKSHSGRAFAAKHFLQLTPSLKLPKSLPG